MHEKPSIWTHWSPIGTISIEGSFGPFNVWVKVGQDKVTPEDDVVTAAEKLAAGRYDAAFRAAGYRPPSTFGLSSDLNGWTWDHVHPDLARDRAWVGEWMADSNRRNPRWRPL